MFFDAQYLTGQLINHDFFLMCLTLSLSGLVGKPLLGKEDFGKPLAATSTVVGLSAFTLSSAAPRKTQIRIPVCLGTICRVRKS